jgi:hypothetical protein
VEDILTVGKGPGPGWRRYGLVAAAAVAALAFAVLRHLPADQHAVTHQAPPVVASEPIPRILPGRPDVPGEASLSRPGLLSGVRLPLAGPRPFWFWPGSGRAEPIGGLPATGAGYQFARVSGGWALTRMTFARPACSFCSQAPLPVYFLPDDARAARWAGTADEVAPAASAGKLWLTSYERPYGLGTTVGTAREVGAGGRALGPEVRLPAGYGIYGAVSHDLLLAPGNQAGNCAAFLLWNRRAGQVSRLAGRMLAVSAREIAWIPCCAGHCVVQVTDVVTGQVTPVRQLAGEVAVSAAFSPDGKYLAVQVGSQSAGTGSAAAPALYVASLRNGQVTAVPGTRAPGSSLVAFGWPGDGDTLVAGLSFAAKVELAAWHPGASRADVIALKPGHGAAQLVLGYATAASEEKP